MRNLKITCALLWGAALLPAAGPDAKSGPTYVKDIAPLLNSRCVGCHRPGEIGPMPLRDYREVRPWAKAIGEAVLERRMPPWHADPQYGKFANERRLTDAEIRTLSQWAAGGAPEGNPKEAAAAPSFSEGWTIGKPDVEIVMPRPFDVPPQGVVDYQYMTTPTNFTEDRWVSAVEVRPGNRAVVHHVIAFILPPEGQTAAQPGRERERFGTMCEQARPDAETLKRFAERARAGREPRQIGVHLVGWAPGLQGATYPAGSAKLIPAGARILFQLHYTPNGKAEVDSQSRVGLIFAKVPVTKTVHTIGISNMRIAIPPGDPNYEVASCYTFARDVTLIGFMPHMHLRGKDFLYRASYPDGRAATLLSVPKYNFNWQTWYELADKLPLPAGSRLDCTAHFDNSPNNKYNPDPTQEVRWGDQTWEEMMIGWISFMADRPPALPVTSSAN